MVRHPVSHVNVCQSVSPRKGDEEKHDRNGRQNDQDQKTSPPLLPVGRERNVIVIVVHGVGVLRQSLLPGSNPHTFHGRV